VNYEFSTQLKLMSNVVKAMRPKHWIKNLLVFALPLSDGLIIGSNFDSRAIARGLIIFFSLSAMSSANYLLNDIRDVANDRQHEKKKMRPFAAGNLSIGLGIFLAVVLAILSIMLSLLVAGVSQYVLLFGIFQFLYTLIFKNLSGYDVVTLSLLYVFRAVIPASYEGIVLTKWFLVIFFAGALFLSTSKRYAEIRYSGNEETRRVLSTYTEMQLALWIGVSLSLLIISYLNWIFTFTGNTNFLVLLASVIPISIILIRVSSLTISRGGEDPTKVLFQQKDNFILVTLWLALYLKGKGFL
jgi:decaprenyl-phosphate phosphoribosyltransferase